MIQSTDSSQRVYCEPKQQAHYPLYPAVAVAFSLLLGCAVGPKYKAPVTNLKPFHSIPPIQARKTDLPAPSLDTWWEGFSDPELSRIIQRALNQNLDLASSLTRVEQARASAKEEGAKL